MTAALIVASLAFAWSMGAHYTGAVMGMLFAIKAVSERWALVLIAIFCTLGAGLASEPVQATVGLDIVAPERVAQSSERVPAPASRAAARDRRMGPSPDRFRSKPMDRDDRQTRTGAFREADRPARRER